MDFIYVAGPALVSFLFAFFAATTNQAKHPMLRLMYTGFSLAALLVFTDMAMLAATYGELVVDTQITNYAYNATGTLVNSTTTLNYTHTSPISTANFDNLWLVVSYAIWLFFIYIILQIFANAVEAVYQAYYKRKGGFDDIG